MLLVKGNTDKIHVETALDKLKDDYQDLEFDIFSMNDANNIKKFILGIKKSEIFDKNKKIYCHF